MAFSPFAVFRRFQHQLQSRRFGSRDRSLDEELATHLAMLAADHERRGLSPDDATRAARRDLGNLTRVREEWRQRASPVASIAGVWRADLTSVWRGIARRPGSSIGICLVASVGVGLTSAMFVLVDPYLFRPLPYADPDALVHISIDTKGRTTGVQVPEIRDWQARSDLFDGLAAYTLEPGLRLRLPSGAAYLPHAGVTVNLFDVLGVPFAPPDNWQSASGSAAPLPLLTPHRLVPNWLGRVSRSPELAEIGRTTPRYPDGQVTFVGQAPLFKFPRAGTAGDGVLLSALGNRPVVRADGQAGIERSVPPAFVGRLRQSVTVEQARSALAATLDAGVFTVAVLPLREYMTRGPRPVALGAAAAGLLMLVVCTSNVANLLVARAVYRARESLTRVALGARRRDLVRLHLLEAGIFVGVVTMMGVMSCALALAAINATIPATYVTFGAPEVTWRTVTFACGASCALFGGALLPVLFSSLVRPRASLAEREGTDSRTLRAIRFALTTAQCAIAVMLLTGALVLGRSFLNLVGQDTGWHGRAVNLSVIYPESLPGPVLQRQIDAAMAELRRISGVSGVAVAVGAMANGFETTRTLFFGNERAPTAIKLVTADYFDVTGTPWRRGRRFTASDRLSTALVVNEAFAMKYFPGHSVLGEHVQISQGGTPVPIVGVVGNTYDVSLDAAPQPTIFGPLYEPERALLVSYVVGTDWPAAEIERLARPALARTSPEGVLSDASAVSDLLRLTVRDRIVATLLLHLFAAAALSVTTAGLVGIVVFVVGRRTREIAIRLAIGASAGHVRRLVMREVLAAAACGGVLGFVGSWVGADALTSLVYGIAPADTVSFAFAAGLMSGVVAAAAWIPAQRAARLPPALAFRAD